MLNQLPIGCLFNLTSKPQVVRDGKRNFNQVFELPLILTYININIVEVLGSEYHLLSMKDLA
jgi:hypothetical protein